VREELGHGRLGPAGTRARRRGRFGARQAMCFSLAVMPRGIVPAVVVGRAWTVVTVAMFSVVPVVHAVLRQISQ
jgi:hypothetical protein